MKFSNDVQHLIQSFLEEIDEEWTIPHSSLNAYKKIKKLHPHLLHEVIIYCFEEAAKPMADNSFEAYHKIQFFNKTAGLLLRLSKTELDEATISQLIKIIQSKKDRNPYHFPYKPLLKKIAQSHAKAPLSSKILNNAQAIRFTINSGVQLSREEAQINKLINSIGQKEKKFLDEDDPLSVTVNTLLEKGSEEDRKLWTRFCQLLIKSKSTAAPSQKWLNDFQKCIQDIDQAILPGKLSEWFFICSSELQNIHKTKPRSFTLLSPQAVNLIKGAIWAGSFIGDDKVNAEIEQLGLLAYKKIPGRGAASSKLGTACLFAFSNMPLESAVSKYLNYRHKITSNSVQLAIEKYLTAIAAAHNSSVDELEEIAIDDLGLDEEGILYQAFGEDTGVFEINRNGQFKTTWLRANDKLQKSVPAVVKNNYAVDLAYFKQRTKSVLTQLSIQKARMEQFFLKDRVWLFDDWKKKYIDHNLLGLLGRNFIWTFQKGRKKIAAIYHNGHFLTARQSKVDWLDNKTKVKLWHPISSNATQILNWRNFLQSNEIKQAFKQAYREVYILTDAERNTKHYSNRFAAHILKQLQFTSLCRVRDWQYQIQGYWDSESIPTIDIPHWDMQAEFWVNVNTEMDTTDSGFYEYIFSDQVRFYLAEEQIDLEEVPPLVFSEVMRDIDLFVGVTSIGNDPNWEDNGDERFSNYWEDYAFGDLSETAKTRKEVLIKLIPRLKIAKQCSFSGKFLMVKGKIRTYKIHMGSGNILMSPNDEYLCIVPDAKTKNDQVFLPFEGDRMLSIILSKAFMLADDTKIKDPTIISQINI